MVTPQNLVIRPETAADTAAIRAVTEAAFFGKPYADGDEHELIGALRDSGVLSLSLIAELDGALVGQISFSPAYPSDDSPDWFTLGPVAVAPVYQSLGIGAKLVNSGLQTMTERGARGCILTGDPNYYQRFGFVVSPDHAPDEQSRPYFQIKSISEQPPAGAFGFHPLFDG